MNNEIHEISDEMLTLLSDDLHSKNKEITKEQKKASLQKLTTYLKENNINLCQVSSIASHSLFGFLFVQHYYYKEIIPPLLPYVDINKMPDSLHSPWVGAATSCNAKLITKLSEKGNNGINDYSNSNGFRNGEPLGIMTSLYYDENKKKNPYRGEKPYVITTEKLEKFIKGPLTALLKAGANPNSFFKDISGNEVHCVFPVLDNAAYLSSSQYLDVLCLYLEHGFNYNLVYDKKTGDNYLQHLIKNNQTQSDNSVDILLSYLPIDTTYKNKKDQTISDFIEKYKINDKTRTVIEKSLLNQINSSSSKLQINRL